jgi:carotenoid cleavage dioxygenase-like enzyme
VTVACVTAQEQGGSDRLIMFSYNEAGMDAKITLYEYDQSGRLLHRSRHTLPGAACEPCSAGSMTPALLTSGVISWELRSDPQICMTIRQPVSDQHFTAVHVAAVGMFHDIAVTQHFYILLENPLTPDVAQLLTK